MDINSKDDGRRGKPECFYCGHPTGHTAECTVPDRSVVMRMTIDYVVNVPRVWNQDRIHFHRNEGSWCAANDIAKLAEHVDTEGNTCGCGSAKFEFVREATPEDHAGMIDLTEHAKQESV